MAGVTADTPDPEGGRIGRDKDGAPDGILYENGRNVLSDIMAEKTVEDIADDLLALDKILLSQGVTTGADMGEFTDSDYKKMCIRDSSIQYSFFFDISDLIVVPILLLLSSL